MRLPVGKRPESGLLALRQGLGLYVNVRPVKLLEPLRWISPLKPERLGDLDIEIVRELAGGMYFGERGNDGRKRRRARVRYRILFHAGNRTHRYLRVRACGKSLAARRARWTRLTCWLVRSCGAVR